MNIEEVRRRGLKKLHELRDTLRRGGLDETVKAVIEEELLDQLDALAHLDVAEELLAGKTTDEILQAAALKLRFSPEELDEVAELMSKIEAARDEAAGETLRILNRNKPVRV